MLGQRRIKAAATTAAGFSRNAGVDDAIIKALLVQALVEQHRPSGVLANAVAGRERVAEDEDVPCGLGAGERNKQRND